MQSTVKIDTKIKNLSTDQVTIEVSIPLIRSMISGEDVIQFATNTVGKLATQELLKLFDTDGSPITFGNLRFTSKGKIAKEYETPYGKVNIERHVYQKPEGGSTFCPLDHDARVINSATPKLAKTVANKYSRSSADEVQEDLLENHGRQISRSQVQELADQVGEIAINKEESWEYLPHFDSEVCKIAIGMDGSMILMRKDGYREAMSGTISFYDQEGNRLHTNYIAASPEYGKSIFLERMTREIEKVKKRYPEAEYVGIADGASENWKFLEKHTTIQITDFYHASEYLTSASEALFKKNQEQQRVEWLEQHCHDLKHNHGAVIEQLKEFKKAKTDKKLSLVNKMKLDSVITYFTNQGSRMRYSEYRDENLPIGSGVTEAACKIIIKQRLCRSGMRWKDRGASRVLALKCLIKSNRWGQFWNKINQYGIQVAA